MSRAKGSAAQNWLAAYLRAWWPYAESAGAGRNGTDVTGTPGVVWECKTIADFKRDFKPTAWVRQAKGHAEECECTQLPPCTHDQEAFVVVVLPNGIGEANIANALAIVPLHVQMRLLEEAGYTPQWKEVTT